MAWEIVFSPVISAPFLWAALAAAVLLTGFSTWTRLRGALWRGVALALVILTLANPSILEEERDPVDDVVALVVDESASQKIGDRAQTTAAALATLEQQLTALNGLEVRVLRVGTDIGSQQADGTNLFAALESGLIDVPQERISGAILITDGQVHDVPDAPATLGFQAPIHVLITGKKADQDRKLTVIRAPRFGIVGETVTVTVRVDDYGPASKTRALVPVTLSIDGELKMTRRVLTGQTTNIDVKIDHGGQNVIEIDVSPIENELSLQNNKAIVLTNGIRDRLRVLLVSGEPHAGERTWRNLLKADPSVDLVHFTILRPPEKQDGTPIGELSLIAFPTRELFSIKLEEFDLIIFDRYRRRGVLPQIYLSNIARFVEQGGALLTAAGPAFATPFSLYRSPLAAVLPAQPTGDVLGQGYKPQVTQLGYRHPVTSNLPGAAPPGEDGRASGEASWGRWFRLVDSKKISGETLMVGPDDRPLLVLDRFKEGRVAQLMSDHVWLWARGFEGGGPQAEMLRRLAHWLMKEPDLEEEDLRAIAKSGTIEITRRSISDQVGAVTVTSPSGIVQTVMPEQVSPGIWRAVVPAEEMGLYKLNDMTHSAVAAMGPLNPLEYADVRATDSKLAPLVDATGGGVFWVAEPSEQFFGLSDGLNVPDIRRVRAGRDMAGRTWLGLKQNNQYLVRSVTQIPLLVPILALILILSALLFGWYREGR